MPPVYSDENMRSFRTGPVLALSTLWFSALLVPPVLTAQPAYRTGTLLKIERKVKITPLEYVFDVVAAYYETVTYELQIRVGNDIYFADYTPEVQPNGPLPDEWRIDQPIEVRLEKRRLFVKLSSDGEMTTYIARRGRVKSR